MINVVKKDIKATTKPTDKYAYDLATPTLKNGNKGDNVKELQRFLNWYCNTNLKLDGDFGELTETKVKVFQKTEGIKVDGIYGKQSYNKAKAYLATEKKGYTGTFPSLPPTTAKIAVECAYAYGTKLSAYKYSGGKPKDAYKKRLNEAFPKRSGWKYAKSRAGASCDVFVGTVLRCSGYKKAPHVMSKFVAWCKKNLKSVSKMQNGDVLTRTDHIMVVVDLKGKKLVANAHYQTNGGTYGIIEKPSSYTKIWRPIGLSSLSKGDTFTSVIHLQRFLNWYGGYQLEEDYVFGNLTEAVVKDFQKREGLEVTGKFGVLELAKAKGIKK